jgi:hypothetical protein
MPFSPIKAMVSGSEQTIPKFGFGLLTKFGALTKPNFGRNQNFGRNAIFGRN